MYSLCIIESVWSWPRKWPAPKMTDLIVSMERVSGVTSMPRTVLFTAPSRSLSITRASYEQARRLASIPADSYTRLAPAFPARATVRPFSCPAWASGTLESAIPAATPDGRPSQLATWAAAAIITASSPEPPVMAPVRRSETNGQSPMTHGWPGFSRLTQVRADRHSARAWASDPARAAGDVAPACPAESRLMGMPQFTWATMERTASSA